ncbi:2OG-Fe dioxygenase family protein [Nocardia rhamnosiphila]
MTLVSSLLIDRHNISGGESAVYDAGGATLLRTTLSTPADLLLGDDRRTLHDVSPVYPVDPGLPAHRDVLAAPIASNRTAHFPSPDRPRPATKT